MDLKNFISTSLTDIVDAIYECSLTLSGKALIGLDDGAKTVDFDIAVTVSDNSNNKNHTGLGIEVIKAFVGLKNESFQETSSSVSRIRFSVPVVFGSQADYSRD